MAVFGVVNNFLAVRPLLLPLLWQAALAGFTLRGTPYIMLQGILREYN
jgi:hypothetical protein